MRRGRVAEAELRTHGRAQRELAALSKIYSRAILRSSANAGGKDGRENAEKERPDERLRY